MSVPVFDRASTQSPFRIDEGYSEDPRCQDGFEMVDLAAASGSSAGSAELSSAREWLLSQPADIRAGFARMLLNSLPTSTVSDIVQEANLRLHFDPIAFLPQELVTVVLANLDSQALLAASQVSKAWRYRAQDPLLWRRQYVSEGWTYNVRNVATVNDVAHGSSLRPGSSRRVKMRPRPSFSGTETADAKRRREGSERHANASVPGEAASWNDQNAPVDADDDMNISNEQNGESPDAIMEDATDDADERGSISPSLTTDLMQMCKPHFILNMGDQQRHFHWQHLYTQRMRLEQNWNNGKYTNFRLPSLDHSNEGHTQCVYTVQYSGKHLVSGSRDMTVRVWDLERGRLKLPPLMGHDASVLCLQFDERPDQDVIISGGSDASVIVWKFSTGELVKKIRRAHSESVLNLRFDDRYLVTCSKDKTIKIWCRKALTPNDEDYPKTPSLRKRNSTYPQYIIPTVNQSMPKSMPGTGALEAYTHIMTLEGHSAAINAIAIHGDQLASASGDRKVILWDLKKGTLIRSFGGHTKGIACVQYDGRRIVSGSSDHTVRIFDSATAAEVATLEGHSNLVRTVQADFSDNLDGIDELYEAMAREQDQSILERERQRDSHSSVRLQRGEAIGLKLPRGGGGNKWSKILSGSYDETVIIWKVDKEGRWYVAKALRQEAALRATGGRVLNLQRRHRNAHAHHHHHHHHHHPAAQLPQTATQGGQQALAQPTQAGNANAGSPTSANDPPLPAAQQVNPYPQGNNVNGQDQNQTFAQPQGQGHHQHNHHHHHHVHGPVNQANGMALPPGFANLPPNHPLVQQAQQDLAQSGLNSRVFKLQFDARRIVACSQETVIVGWDFANGDADIIDACKFFGEPQG